MHLLFHIVYGAHANGTHHKLALDALRHLKCTDADYWQRVFLRHARLYLEGAEAPDDEFKDFENHVLHTRDGLWGGAPEKVRSWYRHVVEALARRGLADGGLLRRRAEPLLHRPAAALPHRPVRGREQHPPRRRVEHRPQLRRPARSRPRASFGDMRVELGADPNWLVELVCRGAELANRHYEKLIAHYDIGRGVVDPPAGLDPVAPGASWPR